MIVDESLRIADKFRELIASAPFPCV
ncbi:MAG: hypothetical protein JWR49_3069, partial [Tardiphaga sp.]|nr:hypothetical protein [Tardiphaga sp.]